LIAPSLDVPVILIDTLARRTTTEVLASKRQRFREGHPDMGAYVKQAPVLVDALAAALRRRPVHYREVGALLTSGQDLLRDRVHCSTELIDRCVERITAAGAYGAPRAFRRPSWPATAHRKPGSPRSTYPGSVTSTTDT
jgi:mevalonate kinase